MITSKDIRLYKLALNAARLSDCNRKHGALIARGSDVISLGCNKMRSNPVSDKWKIDPCQKRTSHAEQLALIYARCDVSDMTLYSARIGGTGKSKPCEMCMFLLQEAEIRFIVYHNGYEIVKERI